MHTGRLCRVWFLRSQRPFIDTCWCRAAIYWQPHNSQQCWEQLEWNVEVKSNILNSMLGQAGLQLKEKSSQRMVVMQAEPRGCSKLWQWTSWQSPGRSQQPWSVTTLPCSSVPAHLAREVGGQLTGVASRSGTYLPVKQSALLWSLTKEGNVLNVASVGLKQKPDPWVNPTKAALISCEQLMLVEILLQQWSQPLTASAASDQVCHAAAHSAGNLTSYIPCVAKCIPCFSSGLLPKLD